MVYLLTAGQENYFQPQATRKTPIMMNEDSEKDFVKDWTGIKMTTF